MSVLRTSATGAKPVMTNETGDVTLLSMSPSCHTVRIDMESLPTGTEIPSAGHNSIPTAFTVSYKIASSPA